MLTEEEKAEIAENFKNTYPNAEVAKLANDMYIIVRYLMDELGKLNFRIHCLEKGINK